MDFAFLYITSIFFIIIFVIIYTVCREKRPKQIHDSSHLQHNRNTRRSTTVTSNSPASSSTVNDLSLISSNRLNSNNQQILQMDPLVYNTSFNSNNNNNIQKLQDGLPSYEEAIRVNIATFKINENSNNEEQK
jgi:hypothetical protein